MSDSEYDSGASSDGESPVEHGPVPDHISTFSLRNATSETPERIRVAPFPDPCAPVQRPHVEFSAPPPSAVPASLEELADPVVLDEVREWLRRDDAAAKVSASKRLSVVVCAQIWNTFFVTDIYTHFSI